MVRPEYAAVAALESDDGGLTAKDLRDLKGDMGTGPGLRMNNLAGPFPAGACPQPPMLAVIPAHRAELIEYVFLVLSARSAVSISYLLKVFLLRFDDHN